MRFGWQVVQPRRLDHKRSREVSMMNLNQPVYWRGRQWAVTDYGIEALSGLYHIPWCNLEDEPSRQRLLTELQNHY
jgi:hypothetical protein